MMALAKTVVTQDTYLFILDTLASGATGSLLSLFLVHRIRYNSWWVNLRFPLNVHIFTVIRRSLFRINYVKAIVIIPSSSLCQLPLGIPSRSGVSLRDDCSKPFAIHNETLSLSPHLCVTMFETKVIYAFKILPKPSPWCQFQLDVQREYRRGSSQSSAVAFDTFKN